MSKRTPIIGGNWKMNLTRAEASALAQGVGSALAGKTNAQVVVFPAFIHLAEVAGVLKGSGLLPPAQRRVHRRSQPGATR